MWNPGERDIFGVTGVTSVVPWLKTKLLEPYILTFPRHLIVQHYSECPGGFVLRKLKHFGLGRGSTDRFASYLLTKVTTKDRGTKKR